MLLSETLRILSSEALSESFSFIDIYCRKCSNPLRYFLLKTVAFIVRSSILGNTDPRKSEKWSTISFGCSLDSVRSLSSMRCLPRTKLSLFHTANPGRTVVKHFGLVTCCIPSGKRSISWRVPMLAKKMHATCPYWMLFFGKGTTFSCKAAPALSWWICIFVCG